MLMPYIILTATLQHHIIDDCNWLFFVKHTTRGPVVVHPTGWVDCTHAGE